MLQIAFPVIRLIRCSGDLTTPGGLSVDGSSHAVYVTDRSANDVVVFDDARPITTTGAPTEATESAVTITGHVDPAGRGAITTCFFEYGFRQDLRSHRAM